MSDIPVVSSAPLAVAAVAELDVVLERLLAAADVDGRRAYAKAGHVSTYGFLKGHLRLGDRAVKHRIAAMKNLTARITPSGEVLDPVCPATAESWRRGVIDLDHVHRILGTLDEVPSTVSAEERASAGKTMAGFAADYTPRSVWSSSGTGCWRI